MYLSLAIFFNRLALKLFLFFTVIINAVTTIFMSAWHSVHVLGYGFFSWV